MRNSLSVILGIAFFFSSSLVSDSKPAAMFMWDGSEENPVFALLHKRGLIDSRSPQTSDVAKVRVRATSDPETLEVYNVPTSKWVPVKVSLANRSLAASNMPNPEHRIISRLMASSTCSHWVYVQVKMHGTTPKAGVYLDSELIGTIDEHGMLAKGVGAKCAGISIPVLVAKLKCLDIRDDFTPKENPSVYAKAFTLDCTDRSLPHAQPGSEHPEKIIPLEVPVSGGTDPHN